ncbi:Serine--tRNA ligase, mitochondrial [Conoideocrella luteorostrata]|uniref:Serine--tRNA ligase, mitochondrial n=1 Tax=Conoideocrella luteorostrata TaxID=1105319 RepID=A0AAJ0CDE0_9HYPO|nr:Serine--tRNA ligase, mitochondrial [Conoideocrella luteorostrata]
MNRPPTCLHCHLRLRLRVLKPRRGLATLARTFADSRRPSIAPKPIIDIKHMRQNPELYELTCLERNYKDQAKNPAKILELHSKWQHLQKQGRSLRERSNLLRKLLAKPATSSGDNELQDVREMSRDQVQSEARDLKGQLSGIERGEAEAVAEMEALALAMPNLELKLQ